MPPPKTAAVREQVIELVRKGHRCRDIEAILKKSGVKVGKSTVADIARQFHAGTLKPTKSAPPAPTPTSSPKSKAKASLKTPSSSSSPASEPEPPTELDPLDIADLDLRNLAKLVELFDDRIAEATTLGAVKLLPELLRSRVLVAKEIARLRPVVPPDPAKDPANVEARDLLRVRLEQLVEASRTSDAAVEQLREHVRLAELAAEERRQADPARAEPATGQGGDGA